MISNDLEGCIKSMKVFKVMNSRNFVFSRCYYLKIDTKKQWYLNFPQNKMNLFVLPGHLKWVLCRVLKWSDIILKKRQWSLQQKWRNFNLNLKAISWCVVMTAAVITAALKITPFKNAAKDSLPMPQQYKQIHFVLGKIYFSNFCFYTFLVLHIKTKFIVQCQFLRSLKCWIQ